MKSLQERTEQSMAKNLKVGMLVCASILAANAAYANYPTSNELLTVTQQTGKIKGTIVDSKTGEPVIGASVKVKGTKGFSFLNSVVSCYYNVYSQGD